MNGESEEIGLRAREEIRALSKAAGLTVTDWMVAKGFPPSNYTNWAHRAPNGISMKYLLLSGADIYYILTGERGGGGHD